MVNRQLVLVAIDHATDMTRAIGVARSVAKARGADVDVIQVHDPRAVVSDAGNRTAHLVDGKTRELRQVA
jgi:hypothetical protein